MRCKITVALAVFSLLLSVQTHAQSTTWLHVETGPRWGILKVVDPNGYFEGANLISYMAGVSVGQEILPNLTLSTGLLYTPGHDGINMIDERPNQSSWQASSSILIPLRAEYMVQPSEYPVFLSPRIGYVHHIDLPAEESYSASSIISSPEGDALSYQVNQVNDQVSTHLLELGLGLNLRFSNSWQASLYISYMTAPFDSESTHFTLDYTNPAGTAYEAAYTSKGNAFYTNLMLDIPLSNIWQNKDYRVRSRIENSLYKGKAVDKRGQIYLGGELGSLWRSFSSNNPAVGARPMEGRGIFRYANLHTGLYAGYMLTNDLGLDIGAYYQRSSTFYAIMYDHEVDFATKMTAPFFLEVPLRFRYFHDVHEGKIHLVLYGGASLLAHFNSGVYNQGSAAFTYYSPAASAPVSATTTYTASGVKGFGPVLRLGTGVEYKLPTEFPLIATFYVNYLQGYSNVGQIEVSNSLPEIPDASTIIYRGSGWSLDLGIKVPFKLGDRSKCGKLPEKPK